MTGHSMKIRILILIAAAAVLAVPTYAQLSQYQELRPIDSESGAWSDSTSYSQGQYMDNPCTAAQDYVWVNYSAYVEAAEAAASVDRYLFNEDTTLGGGTYTASGSSSADVAYTASFSLRQYHKVNTYDDFHVVTVINFDPGSRYTWVDVETACGNGMPDSKE
jgi:hypothetical protein